MLSPNHISSSEGVPLIFSVPLICSVKTTPQTKGTLNTATEQRLSYLDRVLSSGT